MILGLMSLYFCVYGQVAEACVSLYLPFRCTVRSRGVMYTDVYVFGSILHVVLTVYGVHRRIVDIDIDDRQKMLNHRRII